MKLWDLQAKVDSINRIPKPKPKIEKPVKIETVSEGENVKDSNTTSGNTSESDKPATESDAPAADEKVEAADEKGEAEAEGHDEL
ncbi:hypothetical protein SLEP1_g37924 [Rubroshorea leprosula]|uniref:Uncharacterized protein n=1 Tax=Rubroshorea leprosula TaxID=152421 RepID=A0AAV5KWT2_9ROSI|nr:hypothetical protein SLEP1_g37924 [Rubroshorea leprosula]